MNVIMITGSEQPEGCGVTHYSLCLASALRERGVACHVETLPRWTVHSIPGLRDRIRSRRPDVVHMHYPTAAYGYSVAPQWLSLLMPMVITVHEASQVRVLRRLSLYPFGVRSPRLIFTTPYELAYARRWAPWIARRARVINLGSTIPLVSRASSAADARIVHFGFLRPRKGLEQVLELAALLKRSASPERITVVGGAQACWSPYVKALRARAVALPVDWVIDLPDSDVADVLARSKVAYLPFPDGASHRRTSLIAALCHGAAIVTTRGTHTPPELGDVVEFASSPADAFAAIRDLLGDEDRRRRLSTRARQYALRFSWDAIAAEHMRVYESLVAS
jgi:glycosyltransferase involved in cell wall biosynthesis